MITDYLFSGKIVYLQIGKSTVKLPIIVMSLVKFLVMSQNILSLINIHPYLIIYSHNLENLYDEILYGYDSSQTDF